MPRIINFRLFNGFNYKFHTFKTISKLYIDNEVLYSKVQMTLAEIKLSEQVVKTFFNKFDQVNYHKTDIEGKR